MKIRFQCLCRLDELMKNIVLSFNARYLVMAHDAQLITGQFFQQPVVTQKRWIYVEEIKSNNWNWNITERSNWIPMWRIFIHLFPLCGCNWNWKQFICKCYWIFDLLQAGRMWINYLHSLFLFLFLSLLIIAIMETQNAKILHER